MSQTSLFRTLVASVFCAVVLSLNSASGQQEEAAAASPDRAQWENVVLVMQGELARAEARAASMTAQLVALDDDIEARINRIVSLLASVRDSSDGPGNRIRKSKEDALAGIKNSAVYYAQERDQRLKLLESHSARFDEELLAREIAALNGRIETRITQSLAIADSLVQQQDGSGYNHGESQEQRKVRYDGQASVKVKADLVAALRAGIDKQTREIAMRDEAIRAAVDPAVRDQLQKDNESARQIIAARRSQIEELIRAPRPSTRPVGGKAAFELDKLLDEMTAELRRDFAKFKVLVNECEESRSRLKPLRDRLEQATALLAESDPAAAPAPGK
jgi:hypothetical protein